MVSHQLITVLRNYIYVKLSLLQSLVVLSHHLLSWHLGLQLTFQFYFKYYLVGFGPFSFLHIVFSLLLA